MLLAGWVQKPELALLYGDLAPEEAGHVVEKVREAGVPYELRNGGRAV